MEQPPRRTEMEILSGFTLVRTIEVSTKNENRTNKLFRFYFYHTAHTGHRAFHVDLLAGERRVYNNFKTIEVKVKILFVYESERL